jgi:hypothetical protein
MANKDGRENASRRLPSVGRSRGTLSCIIMKTSSHLRGSTSHLSYLIKGIPCMCLSSSLLNLYPSPPTPLSSERVFFYRHPQEPCDCAGYSSERSHHHEPYPAEKWLPKHSPVKSFITRTQVVNAHRSPQHQNQQVHLGRTCYQSKAQYPRSPSELFSRREIGLVAGAGLQNLIL